MIEAMETKLIKKKSELLEQIRHDLKAWEECEPDFDENYFDESDVWSFYEFLLERHEDEWTVIDDTDVEKGGNEA